jgi:hypothetical protein
MDRPRLTLLSVVMALLLTTAACSGGDPPAQPSSSPPSPACPGSLQAYKGNCFTPMAIVFVGCTDKYGFSTTTKIQGGIRVPIKVVAELGINGAYEHGSQEDTAVALEIVKGCLEVSREEAKKTNDSELRDVNTELKKLQSPPPPTPTGQLRYRRDSFGGGVDLTTEGTTDWIMWGYKSSDANVPDRFTGGWVADECESTKCTNRKAIDPAISNYTVIGDARPFRLRDREGPAFSWSDGSPTPVVAGAQGLIYVGIEGNGFSFDVRADQRDRTLRLYMSVYQGRVKIAAKLSDDSADQVTDRSFSVLDQHNVARFGVLEIRYRARSNNQTLKITVVLDADAGGGNVSIFAATLI